jgi:predicted mannosyl-3-phosphoglycerate phosphatase (HAD superfamily)
MLDFQFSVQPQTEQRLKKILNSIQDTESFARSIISYQISELQKSILNLRLDLDELEQKYQMTSQEFQEKFSQGILEDDADFMVWSGLYEMLCQNQLQLHELR